MIGLIQVRIRFSLVEFPPLLRSGSRGIIVSAENRLRRSLFIEIEICIRHLFDIYLRNRVLEL